MVCGLLGVCCCLLGVVVTHAAGVCVEYAGVVWCVHQKRHRRSTCPRTHPLSYINTTHAPQRRRPTPHKDKDKAHTVAVCALSFFFGGTLPRNWISESSSTSGMPLYPTLSTMSGFPAHEAWMSRRTCGMCFFRGGVSYGFLRWWWVCWSGLLVG